MSNQTIIFVIAGVWIVGLSGVVFWMFWFFKRLSKIGKKGNLINVIDKVLSLEEKNSQEIKKLKKNLIKLEEDGELHIQKVKLIRFNPFEEMGGDQSFSMALLDKKNTGIIITGLHTRERTRVYVKSIEEGKSKIDLSEEEEKVLKLVK